MIEMATGRKIDVISLSYNRMMNHIKYMEPVSPQGRH